MTNKSGYDKNITDLKRNNESLKLELKEKVKLTYIYL